MKNLKQFHEKVDEKNTLNKIYNINVEEPFPFLKQKDFQRPFNHKASKSSDDNLQIDSAKEVLKEQIQKLNYQLESSTVTLNTTDFLTSIVHLRVSKFKKIILEKDEALQIKANEYSDCANNFKIENVTLNVEIQKLNNQLQSASVIKVKLIFHVKVLLIFFF